MYKQKISTALLAGILMLALSGCLQNLPAVQQAQETICQPLENLSARLDNLADITVETTSADVKERKAQLDSTIQRVRTANELLNSQQVDELLAAYDELSTTINELPDDQPLGSELVARIQERVAPVQNAVGRAANALNCGA